MEILNMNEIDTNEQEARNRVSKYAHDGFFHYLVEKHEGIRLMLYQKMVPEAKLISTEVIKSEFYSDFNDGKRLVLDIVAKNEKGRIYNIELQCYNITKVELARFQTYGFRLVVFQTARGKSYDKIKKVRQMIINTAAPVEGLNEYMHHFQLMDENDRELPNALYEMNLVQLAYLELKENAEDFVQLMYLFQNNGMYDKIKADKKINEAVNMHEEYMKSGEMIEALQRERDRLLMQTYQRTAREDGLAEGRAAGLAQGKAEGLIEGRAEGRAQGRAEGKAEEKAANQAKLQNILFNLLSQKGITISPLLDKQIKKCSTTELDLLINNIFDITNEKDIQSLLEGKK